MAAPFKIIRIDFNSGVYLAGTVKQAIGLANPVDGETPSTVMGLTRVEEMRPEGPGVLVRMTGRWFFVPWATVRSCEVLVAPATVETPAAALPAVGADLLGDEAALEEATRPSAVKPLKPPR